MSSLAPPLAALSAAGIVMFWRAYRRDGWRGWVLPAAIAAELAWAHYLWRDYGGFLPWARDLLVVAGAAAVLALVVARTSRRVRTRLLVVALGTGVAAMLAAPATWAASVLDVAYAGSSFNATTGPEGGMGFAGVAFRRAPSRRNSRTVSLTLPPPTVPPSGTVPPPTIPPPASPREVPVVPAGSARPPPSP